jgi:PAS domain S-box-containing protein
MIQKPAYEELEQRVAALEKAAIEHSLSEEVLRQNEEKYRQLFELESDALFLIENAGGRILEANRAATQMYGYSREELMQLRNTDLSAEPDSTRQATRNERQIVPVRYHKKKDGTVFPVEITGSHFDWQGRKVHIAAIREIGWRLQAEEALHQSEMRFQETAASIPGAIYQFLINPDGSYAVPYMSTGAEVLFEQPLARLTDPDFLFKLVHPDDLAAFQQSIDEAARRMERWTHEFRIVLTDGQIKWLRGSSNPRRLEDGGLLWSGVMLDISERKLAEEALMENSVFIAAVLNNLPIGIAVNSVDPMIRFDYMNDNFPRFYRTTREALADPDSFWDAVYEDPQFRRKIKSRVLDDCASGDPARMQWTDVPIVCRGAETAYISARNIPVPDKKLMISVVWEVTERKLGEDRIRHLNRVLRVIREVKRLIDRVQDRDTLIRQGCRLLVGSRGYTCAFIVLTDGNDRPVSWAQTGMGAAFDPLAAMFAKGELPHCCGRTPAGKEVLVVEARENRCGACALGQSHTQSISLCVRLTHGDIDYGYLVAEAAVRMSVDEEERALFSEIAGDLAYALSVLQMAKDRKDSERNRQSLEAQLLQAQKMESVGRLAGGVAHDYNNMLSVISGYTELALEKVAPGDPLHDDLKEIQKAAWRSAEITRQLVAFARKQTIAPKVLDLNDTVEGMLKMLRRLIGEDIDLAWLPDAALWPVKMDPAQIGQIMANLCVNARDAISAVGKITIETDNVILDEAYCADHPGFAPGQYVLLAVSDDGCGMDEETREMIFEPFFTTKGLGKGTGLGLATVYGIVKQNDGFINVYSEPEKGTSFKIYLPRHAGVDKEVATESIGAIPAGRNETVLIVEDEPTIMKVGEKILKSLGYRVLAAGKPSEAIRLAQENAGRIHLLLTDVVMPEMNGRELAQRLETLCPDIKTLYMSGYTSNVIAHQGVLDFGVNFIQKPLFINDLALKIRAALQG